MQNANPFSLSFGKEPQSIIARGRDEYEIIESFTADPPPIQVCMITGLRGAGKTVSMTSVASEIRKMKDWIVVDINPERDILQSLAAELSNRPELVQLFADAKINLSFLGLGLEIDGIPPITDVAVALDRMLERLTRKKKRVLLTIDEATSSRAMREFAAQFQIYLRKDYSLFLIMTGLYENIYELQNEKTLTFLYRAPKVEMKPLNLGMMTDSYRKIFDIEYDEAMTMARLTKGYPYAYQVLGYLCYEKGTSFENVLAEYDMYLEEYVYDKIWSELSKQDKEVMRAMSEAKDSKVETIRRVIDIDSDKFAVYRDRLLKKGIVKSSEYGHLEFVLPRFSEFVRLKTAV